MSKIPPMRVMTRARRIGRGMAVGLVVFVLLGLLRRTDLVETLELRLVDLRTRHVVGERGPDPRIVLAEIEERDVEAVFRQWGQRWPWPLAFNGLIVRALDGAGAKAFMVDVLHLDRGAGPDDVHEAGTLSTAADMARRNEAQMAGDYCGLLQAFGRAVIGFELSRAPKWEVPARVEVARKRLGAEGVVPPKGALGRRGAELPVRRVGEGAAALGFVNVPDSLDGVARQAAILGRWGSEPVLSLALATAKVATGEALTADAASVTVGDARQRVHEDASFLLSFRGVGRHGGYPSIPVLDLLNWGVKHEGGEPLPAEARQALEGKIVVFGINIAGLMDVVPSPLGGTIHGPAWQATVLDNLLHGDGRVRAPRWLDLLLLFLLAVGMGVVGGLCTGRWVPNLVPTAAMVLVVVLAFAWFDAGTSIDLLTPLLGILLTWGATAAVHQFTEGRRSRWLESTFGRYMARPIIEALKRDPTLLALGGRERDITVLFSDVAGFTTISTQLEAHEVVRLLNEYLTSHCEAVLEEGGVVDKFEGDAVMAFFGDPVPGTDHALRSCRAALCVQARLPELKPLCEELGIAEFRVRIGLNTGAAVVGNMGSEQRFDYTCMGDTVNLASRLEGAGKAFHASILAGEDTVEAAGDAVLFKHLGQVVVVGRAEPVGVYEVLAMRDEASRDLLEHVGAFERALAAAREGDHAAALEALDEAGRLRPGDGPTVWFRGVVDALREAGESWDGVTVLSRK